MKSGSLITYLLFIALTFIWGSAFVLIEIGLEGFTPVQVGASRIFVAYLCLLPFSFKGLRALNKSDLYLILFSGFLGSLLPATFFSFAQANIDSSISAILGGLTPVFTLLIGVVVFKQPVRILHVFGVVLCFGGASALVLKDISAEGFSWVPALFVCGATICYAINVNLLKYKLKEVKPIMLSSVSMFLVGPIAAVLLYRSGVLSIDYSLPHIQKSLSALIFLGVSSTALGLVLFNILLKRATPLLASSITYLIPVVAISLGYLYGESISITHFFSLILILSGIYLVTRK